ncbi:MAG: hypothetical protein SVK54_02485 [candidate division WOR-3 bacterium]|nr:hypothetical protein [candidate division WOR-3 bacterium]
MISKKASFYTFSIYINTVLGALQGIVAARLLEPYYMGYFSQIKVILSYLLMINFGIINGLLIVLPKADKQKRMEYVSTAFWLSLGLYAVGAAAFLLVFFITGDYVHLYIALIFPIYGIKEVPVYIMRGKGDFRKLAIMYILISFISFISISVFIYFFKFKGALAALAFNVAAYLVLGIITGRINIKFRIIKDRAKELLKKGIYIYLIEFFRFIKRSMEKFVMIFVISREVYAVYTVGIVMVSFFDIMPSTIFQYLLPDFIRENKKWSLEKMGAMISFVTVIMTVLLLCGMYAFTILVPLIIPGYEQSLGIFYLLTFTSLINIWNYIIYNKFVSENKIKYMYISQFTGLFVLLGLIGLGYFIFHTDFSNIIIIAALILTARSSYIVSLVFLFIKKTKLNILRTFSFPMTMISILTIVLAIYLIYNFIHLIPLVIAIYIILFYRRFFKWKEQLTL